MRLLSHWFSSLCCEHSEPGVKCTFGCILRTSGVLVALFPMSTVVNINILLVARWFYQMLKHL